MQIEFSTTPWHFLDNTSPASDFIVIEGGVWGSKIRRRVLVKMGINFKHFPLPEG
jgi:hypothetical protein